MNPSVRPVGAESQQAAEAAPHTSAGSLLVATKRILEMIAAGASLDCILTNLCAAIDAQNPDMMSMVMLMDPDGQRLWPAAAPRVPSDWTQAISPLLIGQNMGSCGTAAFRKERVIISDVATDPLMSGLPDAQSREVALARGLRAAWSQPLMSKDNEVLGTFGLFHSTPRPPQPGASVDRRRGTHRRHRNRRRTVTGGSQTAYLELKASEQELRDIVDAIPQTIVVLRPGRNRLYANRSLLDYTGLRCRR